MKSIRPKLEENRIPYAIVSVDKLIEMAERLVTLEKKVEKLSSVDHESNMIEILVPHISDFRDGKIFVRAESEEGVIYRAEVKLVDIPYKDPEHNG